MNGQQLAKTLKELKQQLEQYQDLKRLWPSMKFEEPHDEYHFERQEKELINKPLPF